MITRRVVVLGLAAACALPAAAEEAGHGRIKAVASISILGDLVANVGGDRVEVATLVGPNGDAHVFSPAPGDAKNSPRPASSSSTGLASRAGCRGS